jgi:tetratricopeptide (TPR) repeat protein
MKIRSARDSIARTAFFDYVALMPFLNRTYLAAFIVALSFVLTSCSLSDQSQGDDEKEPHFVLGKSRVNEMDYSGAVQAFEDALEVNPHSAQAHYQLAMLYENKMSDPAAAIYHYQQYLKFDPKAGNPDIITQHINSCKQQLATDVLQLPSAPAAQKELERLAEENRRLHEQIDKLNAYYAAQLSAARANNNVVVAGNATPDDVSTPAANSTPPPRAEPQKIYHPVARRTHSVERGETMASIARTFKVSLTALEAANPGVIPKKMRVGQVINLPPP